MNPKYERPATPVPPSWPVGDAYLRQSEAALPTVRYSDIFRDARLQQLIVQALANNRDLRIAAANIASTRAQYRIQRANLLPNVSATGRYSYTDRGSGGAGSSAVGEVARAPTPAITVAPGPATAPSVAARVPASAMAVSTPAVEPGHRYGCRWQRQRLVGQSGRQRVRAGPVRAHSLTDRLRARPLFRDRGGGARDPTDAGRRHRRGVAELWCGPEPARHRAADRRQCRAQRRADRARLQGGISPRTDLRQAEQVLATAQADLAQQKTAVAQDVNALQLLVGAPIDTALLPRSIEEAAPPSRRCPPDSIPASSCVVRTWCRPNICCAPPMARSARRVRHCSRASR